MLDEIRESQLQPQTNLSGMLKKKGMGATVGFYRPWTSRKCTLDSGQRKLFYYDGTILKGEVPLAGATVKELAPEDADGNIFAFEISNFTGEDSKGKSKNLTLILSAPSQSEADRWMRAISHASYTNTNILNTTIYESFHGLNPTGPSISDVTYYKNLRTLKQEEKTKQLQTQTSTSTQLLISNDSLP